MARRGNKAAHAAVTQVYRERPPRRPGHSQWDRISRRKHGRAGKADSTAVVAVSWGLSADPPQQLLKLKDLSRRQAIKCGRHHGYIFRISLIQKILTLRGQFMGKHTTAALPAIDQARIEQPLSQCSESLIGIERGFGQRVHRSAGVPLDLPQRVPLHQRDTKLRQGTIEGTMVTVLHGLDAMGSIFDQA